MGKKCVDEENVSKSKSNREKISTSTYRGWN